VFAAASSAYPTATATGSIDSVLSKGWNAADGVNAKTAVATATGTTGA
jgi:hypothetical protein